MNDILTYVPRGTYHHDAHMITRFDQFIRDQSQCIFARNRTLKKLTRELLCVDDISLHEYIRLS